MTHLQPITQASIISGNAMIGSGSGTLRRGIMRAVVGMPPPDVTQLTNTSMSGTNNIQLLHELHPINISNNSCSTQTTSITGNGSMMSTIPSSTSKQPQSILKDPNRSKPQQQLLSANLVGVGVPTASGSLQILNIPTSAGISGNLLMTASGAYDPANLSTFNPATGTTLAYTDADGHLV